MSCSAHMCVLAELCNHTSVPKERWVIATSSTKMLNSLALSMRLSLTCIPSKGQLQKASNYSARQAYCTQLITGYVSQ